MDARDGVEVVAFADAASWDRWLVDHHGRTAGIWVKVAKKHSGIPSVSADELVDVGLCHGWISGQRASLDDDHYLQKYVPRRPGSLWSRVNVDKVADLLAAGRMREPGMAEVRAAQADGRWDAAYESQRRATVPADVAAALAGNDRARSRFEALDKSSRYRLVLPVVQARRQTTRAARVAKLIAELDGSAEVDSRQARPERLRTVPGD